MGEPPVGPPQAEYPELPDSWAMLGRAMAEGAWTGAVLGLAAAAALLLGAGDPVGQAALYLVVGSPWAVGTGAVAGLVLALAGLTVALAVLRLRRRAGRPTEVQGLARLLGALLAPAAAAVCYWALLTDDPLRALLLSLLAGAGAGALVVWRAPKVLRGRGLVGLHEADGTAGT